MGLLIGSLKKSRVTFYLRNGSLMRRTPVVFTPRRSLMSDAILSLSSMPVSDDFADKISGWALVHIRDTRCSHQIVIRCTYYELLTTDEALLAATKTYGGLTKEVI